MENCVCDMVRGEWCVPCDASGNGVCVVKRGNGVCVVKRRNGVCVVKRGNGVCDVLNRGEMVCAMWCE